MRHISACALTALWHSAFRAAPSQVVSRLTPAELVAPCYHLVSDRAPAHVRHLFECRTVNQFKAELDWLLRRFNPISLQDLSSRITANEPLPARSLFLSFDDGLRECVDIVAPVCRAKGVPVTFFLSTAFIGNRSLCYRHKASLLIEKYFQQDARIRKGNTTSHADFRTYVLGISYGNSAEIDKCAEQMEVSFEQYLKSERPYLEAEDVLTLIRQGFSIGGHSVDHPPYAKLPLDRQLAQTADCLQDLTAMFPLPIRSFAFPFLADGVSEQFIDTIFSSRTVDLLFYTGALRPNHNGKVIWRFGVESGKESLARNWKRNVGRQQMDRMRQFLSPVVK
jgi:peptidoglycan/xylan/chitin deacetylase (PgdA/CDA1 family)